MSVVTAAGVAVAVVKARRNSHPVDLNQCSLELHWFFV
jgi:hypothetical protein